MKRKLRVRRGLPCLHHTQHIYNHFRPTPSLLQVGSLQHTLNITPNPQRKSKIPPQSMDSSDDNNNNKGFPPDVTIDIISRLPLKSLVRFRTVSKPWLQLITHSRFPYWVLNNSSLHSQTSLILAFGDGPHTKFYSIGGGCTDAAFEVASEIHFPLVQGRSCEIKSSSCHGLICLSIDDGVLVLWNPSTRDYKVLPLPSDIARPCCVGVCGLGFDLSVDDYKIVSICLGQMLVFSVKRNLWKIIGDFNYYLFNDGIAANGCLYWAAGKTKTVADRILRLDLSDDVIREVRLPHAFRLSNLRVVSEEEDESIQKRELRLLLKDGLLCVFREYDQSIWTMQEEKDVNVGGGVREIWSRIMTIPKFRNRERHFQLPAEFRIYHRLTPKCFTKSGNLLFSVKGEKFVMYDPDELDYHVLHVRGLEDGRYNKIVAYTESLISPDSVRGMNDID